ncbi:endonuclease/exonuclease/phosphatase family protein [candidate division KSB1 bacterium]|nr:endonuclease/exonuclease/phosphatase family protein [candidate division KSB1 bacterium]
MFRIVSINANDRNDQPLKLTQRITELQPDLLVVVEWNDFNPAPDQLAGLKVILTERNHHHGIAVFAADRFVAAVKAAAFYTTIQANQTCRIPMAVIRCEVGAWPFVIFGVHIPPPHLERCKRFRSLTIAEIAAHIDQGRLAQDFEIARRGDPAIILGDFNALPSHPGFAEFGPRGLIDVIKQYGSGYKMTWPRRFALYRPLYWVPLIPCIRIDYIWAARTFKIDRAWSFPIPGSDHRGVAADLRLE